MSPRVFLLILALVAVTPSLVEDMDEDIGEAIFHDNQKYLIYVYNQINKQHFLAFKEYCQSPDVLCTTMNPHVDEYQQFVEFIGAKLPEYFLIVDAENRKKYIMEGEVTPQSLKEFVENFHAGKLQAHISSEEEPEQNNKHLTHLVGKTVYNFVHSNPESYKIILFTTDITEICENCPQILEDFKELAQKMSSSGREFGYMDLVKNQHPDIRQEIVPVVAVYK